MRSPVLVDRTEAATILGVSIRTFSRILNNWPLHLPIWEINGNRRLYRKEDVRAVKKQIKQSKKPCLVTTFDLPSGSF